MQFNNNPKNDFLLEQNPAAPSPNAVFLKEDEKLPDTIRDISTDGINKSHIVLFINAHGENKNMKGVDNLVNNVLMFSTAGPGSYATHDENYNYTNYIYDITKDNLRQNYPINAVLNNLRQQYVRPTVENGGINEDLQTNTYKGITWNVIKNNRNTFHTNDEIVQYAYLIDKNKFAYKHRITHDMVYTSNPCDYDEHTFMHTPDPDMGDMVIETMDIRYPVTTRQRDLQTRYLYKELFKAGILVYDGAARQFETHLMDIIHYLKTEYGFAYITIVEHACRHTNDAFMSKIKTYRKDVKDGIEWMKSVEYNQFGGAKRRSRRRYRRKRTTRRRRMSRFSGKSIK